MRDPATGHRARPDARRRHATGDPNWNIASADADGKVRLCGDGRRGLRGAQPVPAAELETLDFATLQQQIDEQTRQLDALRRALAEQEAALAQMRRSLGEATLAAQRVRAPPRTPQPGRAGGAGAGAGADARRGAREGRGRPAPATAGDARRAELAPIFEQPGVLTPRGKFVLEPSLQYAYSSSNRVALVGYTVIPALLVGADRHPRGAPQHVDRGADRRASALPTGCELEAKVPYVYRSDSGVGRELLSRAARRRIAAFDASGKGLGDVEVTGRYQLNDGGLDSPYYVGSLRFKSRTGKDPFEVVTSKSVIGIHQRRRADRVADRLGLLRPAARADGALSLGSGGVLRHRELPAHVQPRQRGAQHRPGPERSATWRRAGSSASTSAWASG